MKKGFTLIELIVAISILAVGLVVVLQSRLGIISALNSAVNQMKALQFLEEKMSDIEQIAMENGGVTQQGDRQDVMLGSRQAVWVLETVPVDMPLPVQEKKEGEEQGKEEEEVETLLEVIMRLSWQEERKNKSMALVTFLPELVEEIEK